MMTRTLRYLSVGLPQYKLARILVENDFLINKINVKERVTFQNEGDLCDIHKDAQFVETMGTKLNV